MCLLSSGLANDKVRTFDGEGMVSSGRNAQERAPRLSVGFAAGESGCLVGSEFVLFKFVKPIVAC